jgi:hypothetical protein
MPLEPEHEAAVRRFAVWKHRRRDATVRGDGSPSPQAAYVAMMVTAFVPALRAAGLRGSNGRFELPSDRYWAQLGFQKSSSSGPDEVRFTVNLSVISRAEWDLQRADKPYLGMRPTPTAHYGPWAEQARIGRLTPAGADKWWRIIRGVDIEPVQADTLADLITYAVPWLKGHITR